MEEISYIIKGLYFHDSVLVAFILKSNKHLNEMYNYKYHSLSMQDAGLVIDKSW